jgi:hypothetical protein
MMAAIGWLPIAAPEHVHEDHADHHLVVHRHADPHLFTHPHAPDRGHHIDDDDGPLLTLDAVYSLPSPIAVAGYPAIVQATTLDAPVAAPLHRRREFVQPVAHGPPRATPSLRGPPVFA